MFAVGAALLLEFLAGLDVGADHAGAEGAGGHDGDGVVVGREVVLRSCRSCRGEGCYGVMFDFMQDVCEEGMLCM